MSARERLLKAVDANDKIVCYAFDFDVKNMLLQ